MTFTQSFIAHIASHLDETSRRTIELSETTGKLIEKIIKNDNSLWSDIEQLENEWLIALFKELEKVQNIARGIMHSEDIDHPDNVHYELDSTQLDSLGKIGMIQDRVIELLNQRETPIL